MYIKPSLRKICFLILSIPIVVVVLKIRPKKKRRIIEKNKSPKWYLERKPYVIPKKFLEEHDHVISPHNYTYLIQPKYDERCSKKSPARPHLTMVLVHSAAGHFQHRNAIRRTWATVARRITKVVFLLGNPHNETIQRRLREENEKFGDLLQESFHEAYRNITLKAVMGLKYVATKCPTFTYICKSDDDMFVKIQIIYNLLTSPITPPRNVMLCRVSEYAKVEREGKYDVPTSLYNETIWPPFCFGGFWIASTDVITRLYNASLHAPQIYLDDVYVTGILREKLGFKLRKFSKMRTIFCHAEGNWETVEFWWKNRFNNNHEDKALKHPFPRCGGKRL